MGKETLRSIGEATTELFSVDGISPFGGVGNMLYGLYDGFDYSDKIRSHEDMNIIKSEKMDLYEKILTSGVTEVRSRPSRWRRIKTRTASPSAVSWATRSAPPWRLLEAESSP